MGTRRRLIVMRHAKAEPYAETDHDRALARRGRADAAGAGEFLRDIEALPEVALVSSALRTRQTWEEVAGAAGLALDADLDEALYNGGPDAVLERLQALPGHVETVLFVGHNPTAAYLVHLLDDGAGDPVALSEMARGFPPGAVAVLDLEVDWAELTEGSGRVSRVRVPG